MELSILENIGMVMNMSLKIKDIASNKKQEELLEMINIIDAYEHVLSEFLDEGRIEGKKNIINRLLKNHSLDETADLLEMDSSEIVDILNK